MSDIHMLKDMAKADWLPKCSTERRANAKPKKGAPALTTEERGWTAWWTDVTCPRCLALMGLA